IRRNSIHDNGNLGIYLSGGTRIPGVGARQNDPQDPDGDSNNGQNYPVLAAAGVSGSNLLVSGTLNSNPNTAFNLDFYANDVADPSGYGEGQTYVGSTSVTTDNNGDASFSNVSLTFPTGAGRFITATATDPANDTSEFSQALQAVSRGTLSFSTPTYSVNEGSGTATITVNRVGGADGAVSVDYTTSNGTATAGQDYTASNGTLSWADGDATPKTFTIPITEDTLSEANETVTLTLANATGGAIIGANNPATLTIVDNDPLPTLSINDVTQDEGNSGITNFTFTVNLSTASGQSVSVAYATADGTASAGSDYTSTNGTLTFNAGETSKTITVQVNGDTANEPNETFTVNLANPTNATLADNQGAGTITNDDFGAGTIQFSVANYSIAENGGTATITVTRTGDAATSVNYTTSNGTATAGSDYSAASGTLTWNNGDTAPKSFNVPIIDDALNEGDETVNLVLSNPTNGSTFGTPSTAVLTIVDNDSTAPPTPPTISINDISLTEGNSGTTPFNFVVSLSAPSSQTITVNYSTADGTVNPATAGSDYTPTSGILTFNPGETTKAIVVPVVGETAVEPNETFVVNLNNPTNATISRAQGTATILNDDSTTSNPQPGTLQYSSSNYSIGENGSSITVFVTRAGGSDGSVSVNYATSNGTAVAGSDYTAVSGTLTWANGDTSLKSFVIPITDDTLVESNETINLALSTPTGGSTLGTPNTAVLTIIDNDASTTPTTPTPTPISTDPNAPEISINNVLVTEGDTTPVNAIFTVRLSAPSTQRISVNYATQEGTAEENIDYEALAGTVTFNPGETRKNISIPVLGDAIDEPNETFFLVLSSPSQPLSIAHKAKATAIDSKSVTRSPRLGTRDVDFATCLIIDNDAPPTLSINDTRVTEGSAETVRATFTVNLSTVSARTVRVNYSTANGTTNPA
ncbi:MAG: hypothetical protein JOZ57_14355, partial [Abitibacteriaceae bacterium]|nr:hypothetical protein [Abditibacteriaceae bacterium]